MSAPAMLIVPGCPVAAPKWIEQHGSGFFARFKLTEGSLSPICSATVAEEKVRWACRGGQKLFLRSEFHGVRLSNGFHSRKS